MVGLWRRSVIFMLVLLWVRRIVIVVLKELFFSIIIFFVFFNVFFWCELSSCYDLDYWISFFYVVFIILCFFLFWVKRNDGVWILILLLFVFRFLYFVLVVVLLVLKDIIVLFGFFLEFNWCLMWCEDFFLVVLGVGFKMRNLECRLCFFNEEIGLLF